MFKGLVPFIVGGTNRTGWAAGIQSHFFASILSSPAVLPRAHTDMYTRVWAA